MLHPGASKPRAHESPVFPSWPRTGALEPGPLRLWLAADDLPHLAGSSESEMKGKVPAFKERRSA